MRKLLFLEPLIALCAPLTYAQDRSRADFFAGYSNENIGLGLKSATSPVPAFPAPLFNKDIPSFSRAAQWKG